VEVSKLPLRDGDGLRQQEGVVVDLALLAVQAGSRPVGDVVGEPTPDKSRRHKMPRGKPHRMGNVVQVQKMYFLNFAVTIGRKTPVETSPSRH
jgi:hypothetical protein